MKYLTLGEAEREVGVTKSTISRAIKDGRLSANRNEHGHFQIDPAELFRVYEPIERNTSDDDSRNTTQQAATPLEEGIEGDLVPWLLKKVDDTEEELADVTERLEQKEAAYRELRQAYNALPSPESFEEKLSIEKQRIKKKYESALRSERDRQSKTVALQKQQHEQQSEKWEIALAERKAEIEKARVEAEQLREQQQGQAYELKLERERVAALEARGFIDRLLNRKPKSTAVR